MNKPRPAVVLLSGGTDSTTTLAIAVAEGYEAYALTFDYGQRHQIETEAARRVANSLGANEHRIAKIDLRVFGGSALTDDIAVPKQRSEKDIANGIPTTYVPARNTIFLAYALAWAEVIPANDIFMGVNAIDYSGYPDCRPEFIEAFENLANVGTKAGVEGARYQNRIPPGSQGDEIEPETGRADTRRVRDVEEPVVIERGIFHAALSGG